mgnify:CR=1 FL=1
MDEANWIARIEDARKEIEDAESDREAIVIAFTELSRLLIEMKYHPFDKLRMKSTLR